MIDKEHQAREHRESALNLRARAKKIEATNPERAAAWNAEASTLEAAADKLAPSKPKPDK
jgi:hypothetical protein